MPATARRTPPVNAELTRILTVPRVSDGAGGSTDGPPVEKWTGSAPAFTTERIDRQAGGGGVVDVQVLQLVVPDTVPVEVGDSVEYEHAGGSLTRIVDGIEDRRDYGFLRLYVKEVA